jgi:hypothetical protein
MAGTLAQILALKADLVDGKIKTDQVPVDVILQDKLIGVSRIIISPTAPVNPQVNDIWIDSTLT